MHTQQFVVALNSPDPDRLVGFYRDVVGLTPCFDLVPGSFMVGASSFPSLLIEAHSEVTGPAHEPQRVLLNFLVDDVAREQRRLEDCGVQFIRPAYEEPEGVFATFADPDGNYCQLVELRE